MTRIRITAGECSISAMLNDTVAAKEFEKRLPFQISCRDSGTDYCGTAARGRFDPSEAAVGWKNGDILLSDGWFALLYGGQEKSEDDHRMMIIGHFDDLDAVRNLPETVRLTVTADEAEPQRRTEEVQQEKRN